MAHLHHNLSIMMKGTGQELLRSHGGIRLSNMSFMNERRGRRKFKENKRLIIHCCTSSISTSSSAADQQLNLKLDSRSNEDDDESELGSCLVRDEKWQVRRMLETEEEMSQVASVQAEAFHEPVFLFDDFFFYFFEAEVLSGLLYRLRNSPPDRYACLVAEPRNGSKKELAGVVDVTVLSEDSVLQHLLGAKEYIYVSGIAVLNKFRRQKVATALLKACEILSSTWGFDYLALRAYEDDHGARKLYSNAGYRVVSQDPPWTTSWIGRRRRVLMVKETNIQDIRALDKDNQQNESSF